MLVVRLIFEKCHLKVLESSLFFNILLPWSRDLKENTKGESSRASSSEIASMRNPCEAIPCLIAYLWQDHIWVSATMAMICTAVRLKDRPVAAPRPPNTITCRPREAAPRKPGQPSHGAHTGGWEAAGRRGGARDASTVADILEACFHTTQ